MKRTLDVGKVAIHLGTASIQLGKGDELAINLLLPEMSFDSEVSSHQ